MCKTGYKFIDKANLPQNKIMHCVISEDANNAIEFLNKIGVNTLKTKKSLKLDDEISGHSDLLFNYCGKNYAVIAPNQADLKNIVKELGCRVEVAEFEPFSPYPDDILLNTTIINNNMICKKASTSKFLIEFAEENNINIIDSRQGYSKCSICIVNENAIITEDNGIIALLKNSQIDILKIEGGFIKLSDRHTGFLGGASGKIGKNKIFFNGNLEEHPSYKSIINFLDLYNVEPVYDKSYKLTDIGSIIPITEKI
jgi:hypothetical protein